MSGEDVCVIATIAQEISVFVIMRLAGFVWLVWRVLLVTDCDCDV